MTHQLEDKMEAGVFEGFVLGNREIWHPPPSPPREKTKQKKRLDYSYIISYSAPITGVGVADFLLPEKEGP